MVDAARTDPGVEALTAIGELLRRRGRTHQLRAGGLLVLDSGVAQRVDDLVITYARARHAGAAPEQAAEHVVDGLDRHERRVSADAGAGRVRLRLTHPAELDPAHTLPGPAGLIVFPVLDGPEAATRLGPDQVAARGGLEAVGVAALGATLAEPVRVRPVEVGPRLAGWRVTGDLYTASRLLDVARLLAELGGDPHRPHLVIVPSSREVWAFPDPGTPAAYAAVGDLAARRHAASVGRVSAQAYRWDGVRLTPIGRPGEPGPGEGVDDLDRTILRPAAPQPGSRDIGP